MALFHRSKGGPDPYLPFKNLAFAFGAALAVAGFALERDWLVTAAIGILAVTLIGAKIARSRHPPDD